MKPFIDFYLISGSSKSFSIKNKDMYPSGFHNMLQKVNNIPFERIELLNRVEIWMKINLKKR